MNIDLSTPALLFPAIAILMLGYINRYLGTASVIRTFKKDYDSGYRRTEILQQLTILKTRVELSRYMLTAGMVALILACASMFFIYTGLQLAGDVSFGLSLITMIVSIIISLRETRLSNKSLLIELHEIVTQEKQQK